MTKKEREENDTTKERENKTKKANKLWFRNLPTESADVLLFTSKDVRKLTKIPVRIHAILLSSARGRNMIYDIWGSHSGVVEDSSFLRCYAVTIGKSVLKFRRIVAPYSLPF